MSMNELIESLPPDLLGPYFYLPTHPSQRAPACLPYITQVKLSEF